MRDGRTSTSPQGTVRELEKVRHSAAKDADFAWVRSAPYVRSLVRLALSVGFLLESCSAGWKSLLVHLVPSDHSRMSADRSRRMAREVLRENCWVRRSQDVDDWRLGCAPTWLSADR